MSCKKPKKYVSKTTSENEAYLGAEDKEAKRIAREFKNKTKYTKKL